MVRFAGGGNPLSLDRGTLPRLPGEQLCGIGDDEDQVRCSIRYWIIVTVLCTDSSLREDMATPAQRSRSLLL